MIKESGRVVKVYGERILGKAEFLGEVALRIIVAMLLPPAPVREDVADKSVGACLPAKVISIGPPLGNVGPVPEELRKDPFGGVSVPWCIQEAERERNMARRILRWKVILAASWLVTAVVVLRSIGVL
jgi:hypothetical protein